MILEHCNNVRFGTYDIWFLRNIENSNKSKTFINRKLFFGLCPSCRKRIAVLESYRKSDNKYFYTQAVEGTKQFANMVMAEQSKIVYTLQDTMNQKNTLGDGWVYGINKEIKNKQGEVTQVRQYACSLKNNKRSLVKKIMY